MQQPRAVWAVAFACVISFMGIGLVDPILPALASELKATPATVSLLFTSYLVVTAIATIGVNWVSSRIGSKRTLVSGLSIIVIFAALAGAAGSIIQVIWFRGGWGLGNAMFIATSLSVIVASSSGGFSGSIVLYEAALGIGIAVGPLLGGLLGGISWRGPFFGVAVLMAIALLATIFFVRDTPRPVEKVGLTAPIRALGHRGLLTMSIIALLYNWGFFTMLGYAPYPMQLSAIHLGFVFFGWGVLVAVFAVMVAPRLQRRYGTAPVMYVTLAVLGALMIVITLNVHHPAVVIVAVILCGAGMGVNNTLMTQGVMLVAPVERSIASSSYGFVRFIGGGLAPFVAGKIAATSLGQPGAFGLGAVALLVAIPVLASAHKIVRAAEQVEDQALEAAVVAQADMPSRAPSASPVTVSPNAPIVAAIDGGPSSRAVINRAIAAARQRHTQLELVIVVETDIVVELAVNPIGVDDAEAVLRLLLEELRQRDIKASGRVITSVGDHAETARVLLSYADSVNARGIVIGHSQRSPLGRLLDAGVTETLLRNGKRKIVIVDSGDSSAAA